MSKILILKINKVPRMFLFFALEVHEHTVCHGRGHHLKLPFAQLCEALWSYRVDLKLNIHVRCTLCSVSLCYCFEITCNKISPPQRKLRNI
jgi:hypothetical protein